MLPNNLYLIAHKVRGQIAFDVAEKVQLKPDEQWWIIPTSGHRAYPFWDFPLAALGSPSLFPLEVPDNPPATRDHYEASETPRQMAAKALMKVIELEDLYDK